MVFVCLYFFAYTLFHITPVNEYSEYGVKCHIEYPGDRKAEIDRIKDGAQWVNELHPQHAESEVEGNVCDACKHGVSESLEGVVQHRIDCVDKHKERYMHHAVHSVVDGDLFGGTDDNANPKSARQADEESQRSGNEDIKAEK